MGGENTEEEISTNLQEKTTSEEDSEEIKEQKSESETLLKSESYTDVKTQTSINESINSTEDDSCSTQDVNYYAPKSLCIVSRYPHFSTFRECLRELFLVYKTKSPLPVECYIHYLTKILPIPKPGSTIRFQLYHKQIQYSFPSQGYFPSSDVCKRIFISFSLNFTIF